MNKSKLSVILDSFLISSVISFLCYLWINRYIKNAKISLFVCIFIFTILFFGIFKYNNNKYNLSNIKIKDSNNAKKYLEYFKYTSEENNCIYFENLLNAKRISNNIYKNNKAYFYINLKTKLTDIDFLYINNFYLVNDKILPFIIVNANSTDEFFNLINNSPVKYYLTDYTQFYSLMKAKNFFPTTLANDKFKKLKTFKINSIKSLNRRNYFKFLISGITLIILSIYIPFSSYYIIFGTFFLILSIICLFNKQKTQNDNFDLNSVIEKTDTN